MNIAVKTATPDLSIENSVGFARARVGLMIPSSNRLTEPQFRHYLPRDVGVHVTRVQMTGRHAKPLAPLLEDVERAASALGDAKCDVVVFHCTANSMEHGPEGEQKILDAVRRGSGAQVLTTAQAVVEALRAQNMKKMVLISPYVKSHNAHEIEYLHALGFEVVHDVALALPPSDGYLAYAPKSWCEVIRANLRAEADGYFLSCTNTTQIETIAPMEPELKKPIVNSNQATMWAALKRITGKLGGMPDLPALGSLMRK